ncbi:MAG: nucleotidyltransferase domain-containing protein [Thiobacillus sp.]|nr:nucleotidyltransferase domain-containing protein [Thiobacillus sp.]
MAKLDLPEHCRLQLVPLFEQHVPGAEVWAYGSRVRGQSHASSDLDLVVRNPADLSQSQTRQVIGLREAIRESNLPILVDVLDWANIPPPFRGEIERAHVVIYAPSKTKNQVRHKPPQGLNELGGSEPRAEEIPRRRETGDDRQDEEQHAPRR